MVEIIEHGREKFVAMCNKCGCRFTYQLVDLDKTLIGREFINCPDCKKRLYHKDVAAKENMLRYGGGYQPCVTLLSELPPNTGSNVQEPCPRASGHNSVSIGPDGISNHPQYAGTALFSQKEYEEQLQNQGYTIV